MKVLLAHPGASWSTHDVFCGLSYGLKHHGVQVIPFRLDQRLVSASRALHFEYRQKRKEQPDIEKPNHADVQYHASVWALEMALRHQVDVVLIVSGMFFSLDAVQRLKQAGVRICVLFTETPYDVEHELRLAAMVDGCWTNERSAVPAFQAVNRCAGYLPHAWHPEKHYLAAKMADDLPHHDVVFVGSAFPERVTFFNAIDWTGIDLGLYGHWGEPIVSPDDPAVTLGTDFGISEKVQPCIKSGAVTNEFAAALYRRAKIGLNLYRRSKGWAGLDGEITHAESLSPRAYELAACGAFHLSDARAEVSEIFGDCVPTFTSPQEAEALIRRWLADDAGRLKLASQLPACVAEKSWQERAMTVIGDLQRLMQHERAA